MTQKVRFDICFCLCYDKCKLNDSEHQIQPNKESEDLTMKRLEKEFKYKTIENWGSVNSDEAKSFFRKFKNAVKRTFPDATLYDFKGNHYDISGFIEIDGRFVYVSYSIPRGCPITFDPNPIKGILIRAAKNEKDYRGACNHFCTPLTFEYEVTRILTFYDREMKLAW